MTSTGRWATPDGVTVDQVTLSGTPAPSRPGDPAKHYGPRTYLRRTAPGGRDRWYSPDLDDLKALAEREGWQIGRLRELPTYAVVDTDGGTTYTHGSDGEPFGRGEAASFAAERNDAAGPGSEQAHRVYLLTDVTDQVSA